MFKLIKRNIRRFGYHVYIVSGGTLPRFAYTIGLRESIKAELIIAGAIYYTGDEVKKIIKTIYRQLKMKMDIDSIFTVDGLGSFTLRHVHNSWNGSLLLGALDFYNTSTLDAFQIVPDEAHWTIDIPNLKEAWSISAEPVWQWLHEEWPYNVSPNSTATTNIDALRGERIPKVATGIHGGK